ncbi:MAG: glycosyltransferase family 2 protein [Pseudomonadota bacterium]
MLLFPAAEEILQPAPENLKLSIVIPTYNRPDDLGETLDTILDQTTGGLDSKIEIILSDNASTDNRVAEVCRAYTEKSRLVSYYRNAENLGQMKQIFMAPARARGPFCWVYGDDDPLLPGALGKVMDVLEKENVKFLSVNKEIRNRDLSKVYNSPFNHGASQRYDRFADFLATFGINQIGFISCQIFCAETFNAIDPEPYLKIHNGYQQAAAYMEAFYDQPTYYLSDMTLIQRYVLEDDEKSRETLKSNFKNLTTPLIEAVETARAGAGIPDSFYETWSADKFAPHSDTPALAKFSDGVVEYMYRAIGGGVLYDREDWALLDAVSANWRDTPRAELARIRDMNAALAKFKAKAKALDAELAGASKLSKQQKRAKKKKVEETKLRLQAEGLKLRLEAERRHPAYRDHIARQARSAAA